MFPPTTWYWNKPVNFFVLSLLFYEFNSATSLGNAADWVQRYVARRKPSTLKRLTLVVFVNFFAHFCGTRAYVYTLQVCGFGDIIPLAAQSHHGIYKYTVQWSFFVEFFATLGTQLLCHVALADLPPSRAKNALQAFGGVFMAWARPYTGAFMDPAAAWAHFYVFGENHATTAKLMGIYLGAPICASVASGMMEQRLERMRLWRAKYE